MANIDFSSVPYDLVLNIINIIVLFLIVKLLVYKPVKKFLAARQERIDKAFADAAAEKQAADESRQKYEKLLEESKQTAAEELLAAQNEAHAKAEKIVDDAKKQSAQIIEQATAKTQADRKKAIEDAKSDVAELAVTIAGKVLARNVNDADNMAAVEEFLKQ